MAKRPIFAPVYVGEHYIRESYVDFKWHPGMSLKQKQRSILELHSEAKAKFGLNNPLEISSKSDVELGVSLSSFNLTFTTKRGRTLTVESAFQGSKVFENGGPFADIFEKTPKEAKRDQRLRVSGELIEFNFFREKWPTRPMTLFYDWIYINALVKNPHLVSQLEGYDYFTDIEFNPDKSINCQARSLALFISLRERGLLESCLSDRVMFEQMHIAHMPVPVQTGTRSFSFGP